MKHIQFRDIERCPFVSSDPGYDRWKKDDEERLKAISEGREKLRIHSYNYLSHEDRNIRDMAIYIIGALRDE